MSPEVKVSNIEFINSGKAPEGSSDSKAVKEDGKDLPF